jgi:nucleoside phosphorylase
MSELESVLFVSAIPQELEGLTIKPSRKLALGVGNLESAIKLILRLKEVSSIKEVIFIGSCGTYDNSILAYPSFIAGNEYYYYEMSEFLNTSYVPELLRNHVSIETGLIGSQIIKNLNIKKVNVNSPNSLTIVSKKDISNFPPQFLLENMESFGLAYACKEIGVGFTSLFAVTNEVGPQGSENWRKNYKNLAIELNNKISQFFSEEAKS